MDATGATIFEAINMASLNPAEELGISHKFGSIRVGAYADMTILDSDFNVKQTIIEGSTVYKA
jgi:N-acetylglucosamine-6-phosphate deacetylase